MGALMAMQITGQVERAWRCSDNVMRTLTLDQITRAGIAVSDRRQALIDISDTLSQAIAAAQTAEEVAAIEWPAPEPDPPEEETAEPEPQT